MGMFGSFRNYRGSGGIMVCARRMVVKNKKREHNNFGQEVF